MKFKNNKMSTELSVKTEEPVDNKVPTKQEESVCMKKMVDKYTKFEECMISKGFDTFMTYEVFVFIFSFLFLAGEDDLYPEMFASRSYLFYFNALLVLDFFFRLLSVKIESMKREYWNTAFACIFPMVMWLLAGYYEFDSVFGGEPVQVLNILLFLTMNLMIIGYLIYTYVSLNTFKKCIDKCKKKDKQDNNEVMDIENPKAEEVEINDNPDIELELGEPR